MTDQIVCPRCNSKMVLRTARKSGDKFYGCSNYPRCRQTLPGTTKATPQKQVKKFDPTPEQATIFNWVQSRIDNPTTNGSINGLLINACAGSGKTTTSAQAIGMIKTGSIVYLTFDRASCNEALEKGLPAKTTHQLGLGAVRTFITANRENPDFNVNGKFKIRSDKSRLIAQEIIGDTLKRKEEMGWMIYPTSRVISYLKASVSEPTAENIEYFLDWMSYTAPEEVDTTQLGPFIQEVWKQSITDFTRLDFDDMIFLPVYYDLKVEQFDWVFGDEVQDWNECQMQLIQKTVTKNVVLVGDRNQAIYLFRLAKSGAMDELKTIFNCEELPLSVTFRVPRIGVELVNSELSHIEFNSFDGAKEGSLDDWSEIQFFDRVQPGDFVLCRYNAPIIKAAFQLLKEGVRANILGRNLGENLKSMVKRYAPTDGDLYKLEENLFAYRDKEGERLLAKGNEGAYDLLNDKIDAIVAIAEGSKDVDDLIYNLDVLFVDEPTKCVLFSTVHRAKGREAERVIIYKDTALQPNPAKCKTEEELKQEINTMYVGYTRFQSEMIFVD